MNNATSTERAKTKFEFKIRYIVVLCLIISFKLGYGHKFNISKQYTYNNIRLVKFYYAIQRHASQGPPLSCAA